jgi:hypothetical protein
MIKFFSAFILFFLFNNLFAATTECHLVGGIPSTFMVTKFNFTTKNDTSADFTMSTTSKGDLIFSNVECKVENIPDQILSCEHDDFVMILMTDEKPLKAVINPIVYAGKEYGPFFYLCK